MGTQHQLSLAEANAERMDEFIKISRGHIAQMCRHFYRAADMDRALGFKNATAAWLAGRSYPSYQADLAAQSWMQINHAPTGLKTHASGPGTASNAVVLVVICPTAEVAAKVERLSALMGCQTEGL